MIERRHDVRVCRAMGRSVFACLVGEGMKLIGACTESHLVLMMMATYSLWKHGDGEGLGTPARIGD